MNLTSEAHPLHVHLLDFRVVNRQRFASDTNTLTKFNQFLLGYPYRLNQQYLLETTTDLGSPIWTPLEAGPENKPVLDIPNQRWLQKPPPSPDPRRFYRVQPVLPSPATAAGGSAVQLN